VKHLFLLCVIRNTYYTLNSIKACFKHSIQTSLVTSLEGIKRTVLRRQDKLRRQWNSPSLSDFIPSLDLFLPQHFRFSSWMIFNDHLYLASHKYQQEPMFTIGAQDVEKSSMFG
jgi:hypothetical protein